MDAESSLLWRGPCWYAGRDAPPDVFCQGDSCAGLDLVEAYHRGTDPVLGVPSCVIVDAERIDPLILEDLFAWIQRAISRCKCEIPVFILSGGRLDLPRALRASAVIDSGVPDDVIFILVCIHQRALLRSEEARLRRAVFGRIPGYGAAPHYAGTSGLLIVGLSGHYLEWQHAIEQKVEVLGALDGSMAAEFLSQRAFDAVIIDGAPEEAVDNMRLIRRDPRFAALPILTVCEDPENIEDLFRLGASDVIYANGPLLSLSQRVATSVRFGKRRRLADRILAESQTWLHQQIENGGVPEADYINYLEQASELLEARGLSLWEMRLLPENFEIPYAALDKIDDLYGMLLSIADATSRDEDLVCFVRNLGPVAVLKNQTGKERLQKRINSILQHTVI